MVPDSSAYENSLKYAFICNKINQSINQFIIPIIQLQLKYTPAQTYDF